VRSDRRLLRRVLQNLLANGIKYTPAGKVVLGVRRRGDTVSVQVGDTGPGIPKGKRSIIFKEFQRLEETASSVRGLGLGLSIVERIGKVLDHPVALESVPGRGSVFSVDMPRAAPSAATLPPEPPAQPIGRLSGLRVVCIDNEPTVLQGMQALLGGWGCSVITARGSDDALEQLRKAIQPPDIILADYHLDDGTGTGAIAALRAASQVQVPAIIITADHSAEVLREVRLKGHALLRKPLKAAALRALMHQLTWRRAVAAE
jgi:CheY-like chemotaxis protein/anti-sigma regulatory factor (Ser/Thr protein kinase)